MAILQRKPEPIYDPYSSSNHVPVTEELLQYSHIFKLLSIQHEEYFELIGVENQRNRAGWFDDLEQDLFTFKHNIHSWMRESAEESSSRGSSRESNRSTWEYQAH